MNKFQEIISSWITASNPSPEEKALSEDRAKICNKCDHRKYLKTFDVWVCNQCNCPLGRKIFSPINSCPLQKWEK